MLQHSVWLFLPLFVLAKVFALPSAMDTSLNGTWTSGNGDVVTGQDFYNLVNKTFNVPNTTGISYSFLSTNETSGFWEQALYQYSRNDGPDCYTLQLIWQHGNYTIHPNNSITLDPFKADGLQQFTSTCNHDKDRVEYSAQQEFMQGFDITTYKHLLADEAQWSYKLQLYNYDGSLKTPMYLAYRPALMFPPSPLHMTMVGFNDE